MTNDLVSKAAQTGLASLVSAQNPFTALATEFNVPSGAFLKFSGDTGQYTSKSGQPIEHGNVLAFNMMEMRKGWICWKGGKNIEQHVSRVMAGQPMLTRDQLKDHGPYEKEGEGWVEQVGVPVRDLEGGEQMEFNLSSYSGRTALIRLAGEYGSKARMNLDPEASEAAGVPVAKIPLVEISAQSFQPKRAPGTKWAPVFKIVGWMTQAELAMLAENAGTVDEGQAAQHAPASNPQPQQQVAAQQPAAPMSARKGVRIGQRV